MQAKRRKLPIKIVSNQVIMNDDSTAVPHRTAPQSQKHRVIEQIKRLTLIENRKQTESRKNMVHRTNSDLLVCSTLIIRIFSSVRPFESMTTSMSMNMILVSPVHFYDREIVSFQLNRFLIESAHWPQLDSRENATFSLWNRTGIEFAARVINLSRRMPITIWLHFELFDGQYS